MIRGHTYKRNPKRIRETKATLRVELERLKRERAIEQSAAAAFSHVTVRLGNIEETLAAIRKNLAQSHEWKPPQWFRRLMP
jgi:hypothetical protein